MHQQHVFSLNKQTNTKTTICPFLHFELIDLTEELRAASAAQLIHVLFAEASSETISVEAIITHYSTSHYYGRETEKKKLRYAKLQKNQSEI